MYVQLKLLQDENNQLKKSLNLQKELYEVKITLLQEEQCTDIGTTLVLKMLIQIVIPGTQNTPSIQGFQDLLLEMTKINRQLVDYLKDLKSRK
jgi:hypothetical protein